MVTNSLVMAEIVWTLESFYRLPREAIKKRVLAILNTPGLEVIDSDLVLQAITWHADQNVDFTDALKAAWLLAQNLQTVCTFDRKHSSRMEGITEMVPGQAAQLAPRPAITAARCSTPRTPRRR